jgi:outer membrane receptor protein involved in Fe transport
MNQIDSAKQLVSDNNFVVRWDYKGTAMLFQPFAQWKVRISEKMDFTAGLHAQFFTLSNSKSILEPRLGWKYKMNKNQSIFAGAGMHSGMQPLYTYTYHKLDQNGAKIYHNKNMDFTRSLHTGIGYEKSFNKGFNVRTEAYYQYIYNVPVTVVPSAFSMINMGSGFSRIFADSLQNTGTGVNYGIELTIQKYFDKSFFFLFSGTLYDSKYTGSDNIVRNTSYNGRYVANFLTGKEFKIGDKQIIGIGAKITGAGGRRYGLVDIAQTDSLKEIIFRDSLYNDLQFKDYFRMDLKISWRMNAKKVTHEFGLDLVNILNTRNLLNLAYAPSLDPNVVSSSNYQPISQKTQLGFLPIFYYKIDFKIEKGE